MSVAEQHKTGEQVPYSPEAKLAGSTLLGSLFVLACVAMVFNILPTFWHQVFSQPGKELLNPFLSGSLLIILEMGVIVGLGYLTYWLLKNFSIKGLRAGSVLGALTLFFIAWITLAIGERLDVGGDLPVPVRIAITLVAAVGLVFGAGWIFMLAGFRSFLISLEDQGWFSASSYKPNQGHKVRRATVAGILAIGVCGIYTMVRTSVLGSGLGENTWYWWIPFTTDPSNGFKHYLPLVYRVNLVVPLLLGCGLIWLSYRIVSWPLFADFLIATEAEINKVSWTTRKRLVTDTIVVLVTVFLLTGFLFVVDIVWIKVLSNPFVQVLYVDLRGEQAKQQQKASW